MTIRMKSLLILLATLAVGVVLGWLASNLWHDYQRLKRFEKIHVRGRPFGLHERMERLLRPTEAQRDTLRAILDKYHQRFVQRQQAEREFFSTMLDSMTEELRPILTEEQIKRLERRRYLMRPGPSDMPPMGKRPRDKKFRQLFRKDHPMQPEPPPSEGE